MPAKYVRRYSKGRRTTSMMPKRLPKPGSARTMKFLALRVASYLTSASWATAFSGNTVQAALELSDPSFELGDGLLQGGNGRMVIAGVFKLMTRCRSAGLSDTLKPRRDIGTISAVRHQQIAQSGIAVGDDCLNAPVTASYSISSSAREKPRRNG